MSDDLIERLRHGRTVQEREQIVIDDLRRRGLLGDPRPTCNGTGERDSPRREAIEECAKLLDESAQEFNRLRDPGMANHDRALARKLRALGRPRNGDL